MCTMHAYYYNDVYCFCFGRIVIGIWYSILSDNDDDNNNNTSSQGKRVRVPKPKTKTTTTTIM